MGSQQGPQSHPMALRKAKGGFLEAGLKNEDKSDGEEAVASSSKVRNSSFWFQRQRQFCA